MYKAEGLSRVFQVDPQMQLPLRPRFSEDYFLVPMGETALMIVGGEKPEVFRGKSAATLLPLLIPMLDGTRTFDDLFAVLPNVSQKVIRDAVSLLFFRGLLEEGETEEDRASFTDEERERYAGQLRFFGRFSDVNRISRNRFGAQRLLKESRVLVLADGTVAPSIVAGLARTGAGAVTVVPEKAEDRDAFRALVGVNPSCELSLAEEADVESLLADHDLVVAVAAFDRVERWLALDAACRRAGVRWIRCIANDERAEVGPLFTSAETACYRCYVDWHGVTGEEQPCGAPAMAAIAFLELTIGFELSKVFLPNLIDRTRRLELATSAVTEHKVLRVPRCGACGTGREESAPVLQLPDDLAAAYHLSTNHHWSGMNKKAHQVHYSEHVANLNHGAFKVYRTLPSLALPAIEEAAPLDLDLAGALAGQEAPPRTFDLEALAQLCGWTARWRDMKGAPTRFVPSGGGLCSADLYVVAWDVEGLAPGVYHYDGSRHRLEILREGDVREELRGLVAPAALVDGARAVLVQTAQIARFHSKYGPRAYRYAHLDAGVMTMSLRVLGRAAGVQIRNTGRFADDGIASLLGLSPYQELPTQVLFAGDHKGENR